MTGLRNTLYKDMLKILITSLWASLITKPTRMYRHEKAMFIFVSFLMIPVFSHAQAVEEPQNPLKITLSSTYVTQHYWRGIGRGKLLEKHRRLNLKSLLRKANGCLVCLQVHLSIIFIRQQCHLLFIK